LVGETNMQDAIAIQSLKTDIALLRQHVFPPQYLEHVEGLPIYYGLQEEVENYYQQWQGLIERAQELFGLIKHVQKNLKLSAVLRVLLKNAGSLKQTRYLRCKNGCKVMIPRLWLLTVNSSI